MKVELTTIAVTDVGPMHLTTLPRVLKRKTILRKCDCLCKSILNLTKNLGLQFYSLVSICASHCYSLHSSTRLIAIKSGRDIRFALTVLQAKTCFMSFRHSCEVQVQDIVVRKLAHAVVMSANHSLFMCHLEFFSNQDMVCKIAVEVMHRHV